VTIKDDDSCTPLHLATSGGHLEIVKLLIDKQADIDAMYVIMCLWYSVHTFVHSRYVQSKKIFDL